MMTQPSTSDTSHLLTAADFGDDTNGVLVRDQSSAFKPLKTIAIAVIQIFFNLLLFALSIFYLRFPGYCKNQRHNTSSNEHEDQKFFQRDCGTIVIFSMVLIWLFTWILQQLFNIMHRIHRSTGYLQFYSKIYQLTDIPLATMTIVNMVILIAVTMKLDKLVFDSIMICEEPLLWFVLQALSGLELVIISITLIIYIARVARFNMLKPMPDVFNQNNLSAMPLVFNARTAIEVGPGVREPNKEIALLHSVCGQQADLIDYLRHRCNVLSARLHQVTTANA